MKGTETTPTRKRRLWPRLLAATMSMFIGLAAAELLLRALGISYPLPYIPDKYCATRLEPGFHGYWSKEGGTRIQVNKAGFRDREHTKAKPRQTIRVAVLGDSFIEAFQVPINAMFGAVLQGELSRIPMEEGRNVEVLSFGVSGWGTASELMALRHHVWRYDPDIVLLAFFPGNDLFNNSRELDPWDCRPFFVLKNGELVPDLSFRQDSRYRYAHSSSSAWKRTLINASRILQVVQAVRLARAERAVKAAKKADASDAVGLEVGLSDACFLAPAIPAWQEAWAMTDRLIEQFQVDVAARGKLFVLMPVTLGIQVHPDQAYRRAYARRIGAKDLRYSNRRLRALAAKGGFPLIPLVDEMRKYAETHNTFLHGVAGRNLGKGHWNEKGHRLAAEICARNLARLWQEQLAGHAESEPIASVGEKRP